MCVTMFVHNSETSVACGRRPAFLCVVAGTFLFKRAELGNWICELQETLTNDLGSQDLCSRARS
jgi:hypothetical protein